MDNVEVYNLEESGQDPLSTLKRLGLDGDINKESTEELETLPEVEESIKNEKEEEKIWKENETPNDKTERGLQTVELAIKFDNIDWEMETEPKFILDKVEIADPDINVPSADIEELGVSRFTEKVKLNNLFKLNDRVIAANTQESAKESKEDIKNRIVDSLRRGKVAKISLVEKYTFRGQDLARFVISYRDVVSLLNYFGDFNPQLRAIYEGNEYRGEKVPSDYILEVGL